MSRAKVGWAARRLGRWAAEQPNSDRGFTLAETMVVVAVIGILAGVGGSYFLTELPTYRVNGAVRQIVGDLRLAKSLAIERGRETYVSFDTGSNAYSVYEDTDGSSSLSGGDNRIKTETLDQNFRNIEFSTAVSSDSITFPGDVTIFYPRGTANSGSVYLHPRSNDVNTHARRERRITVIISTGRAREYRYTGSTSDPWE